MRTLISVISILLSIQSFASSNVGCAIVGASMYIELTDAIIEDLNITRNQIIQKNVSVEVISLSPISKVYAEQLAEKAFKYQTTHFLSKMITPEFFLRMM